MLTLVPHVDSLKKQELPIRTKVIGITEMEDVNWLLYECAVLFRPFKLRINESLLG